MPARHRPLHRAEGKAMKENSKPSGSPEDRDAADQHEDPEIKGRYTEGRYGAAGSKSGRHAEDEEGQYTEGSYGEAGSEGGVKNPTGDDAEEAGRFVEADYGEAGAAPGRSPESEIGQYAEGDYGKDGKAGPQRAAKPEKD